MARDAVARTASRRAQPAADAQELPDYCARPSCRAAFVKTVGPGRPQAFCSELCRRAAERELRQIRSRLNHFESVVEQLRVDIAAFGGKAGNDDDHANLDARRAAEDAITRVAGVLAFLGDSPDPVARELRDLHTAVAPIVLTKP